MLFIKFSFYNISPMTIDRLWLKNLPKCYKKKTEEIKGLEDWHS